MSFVYELPFGRGQAFSISNPILNAVAGGWSTAGIFTTRSGQPFNAAASGDIANVGAAKNGFARTGCEILIRRQRASSTSESFLLCFAGSIPFRRRGTQ